MEQNLKSIDGIEDQFDLIIVGGGINGTGVARDAALRGLRVCLVEQGDLGCATSSMSTKLIHGGLRYLEFGAFRLVRDALRERALLMKLLPGFIRPLRFILPFKKGMRSRLLLRLGLWIYDHLGPQEGLLRSVAVSLTGNEYSAILKSHLQSGFEYSDCWVDDARLVVFNALEASQSGADIRPFTQVKSAERVEGRWHVCLADGSVIYAKALVNATGPFVNHFIEEIMGRFPQLPLRLVRGSHIVVPRIYDLDKVFILQQDDGRIIFTLPYEKHFTLIGTTEVAHQDGIEKVEPSDAEIEYLLAAVQKDFRKTIKRKDICWSFAGVRPLFDEGKKAAHKACRDYKLAIEQDSGVPVVHVYGGKITTFRKLAADVVDKLVPYFPDLGPCRTGLLPYGAFDEMGYEDWVKGFHEQLVLLPLSLRTRWLQAYGRRVDWFLTGVKSKKDLGVSFGAGLYEREVRYLMTHEWARTVEDVLWRRTKLGLHMDDEQRAVLTKWVADQSGLLISQGC